MLDQSPGVPVTATETASLPRQKKRSLHELAQYFHQQYDQGCVYRHRKHLAFMFIQSYLRMIHFFGVTRYGQWQPIPPEKDKIRAAVPVMLPMYQHILGILNSNQIGVTVTPLATTSTGYRDKARAEAAILGWQHEADFISTFDRANQFLLSEGTVGLYREIDFFDKTVRVRALPGSQIFPIPFDATDPSEVHGYMLVGIVTKGWLELQDEILEAATGKPASPSMASRAGRMDVGMSARFPYFSGPANGVIDGAVVRTVLMKPSPTAPNGEYFFMIGSEIVRYMGEGHGDVSLIFDQKRTPLELVHYAKTPNEFLGIGPCEMLINAQRNRDFMRTKQLRRLSRQNGVTIYDSDAIQASQFQDEDNAFIPFTGNKLTDRSSRPVYHVPAAPLERDTVIFDQIMAGDADASVGFRSGIIFGQQEGRTESGPATSLLAQNAMATLQPALSRLNVALDRTYEGVLDMLHRAWPLEKRVRIIDPDHMGREITFDQQHPLPWSSQVLIQSSPLLAGGVNAQLSMLFQLRQMPGPDGVQGTEISSREFRAALAKLNRLPRGLDLGDRASARIRTRINQLIGDTQRPAVPPSDPGNPNDRMVFENHRMAVEMYAEAILDDSFPMYAPPVQQALMMQLQFHRDRLMNAGVQHPQGFDDDVEKMLSSQIEQYASAAEADPFSAEGTFAL